MELNANKQKLKEYRERAKALVAQMTLEEKVAQTLHKSPAIERLGIKNIIGGMKRLWCSTCRHSYCFSAGNRNGSVV